MRELKKLGIRSVSKTTVANILREAGLDPGPKRGEGTWSDFVQRHTSTLWACDFLSVRSLTTRGFVELFALVFIHYESRRAFVAGVTANPDGHWVTQQARNASMQMAEWGLPATHLLIDYDSKFPRSFDAVFTADGTEVKRVGPRAPNLNSVIERFLQSLRRECLDHFVICGVRHLIHLLREYVDGYCNTERPHQAKGNVPLTEADRDEPSVVPFPSGEVKCKSGSAVFCGTTTAPRRESDQFSVPSLCHSPWHELQSHAPRTSHHAFSASQDVPHTVSAR